MGIICGQMARSEEEGQGLVEYALILALIAIVVIGVLPVIGPRTSATFEKIGNRIPATKHVPAIHTRPGLLPGRFAFSIPCLLK
jgi:pilus assembly protein Flp/PilA